MAVNRYTKLTPTTYNPRTLQELMVAPSYMRKQHDLADEAIGQYETEIAKVDPLTVHSELAMQEQKRLQDELSGYADELASNGFSNYNKSNLIRFNKKYQNAISPTGIIGKANTAKKQYEIEKAKYIANATKMGYSPEAAGMNWDKHAETYMSSFDGKNISNIDSLYAPEYVNAVEEAHKLFKSAGLTETDIVNLGKSNIITKDPRGQYVITKKGRDYTGNNIKQLEDAVNYLNKQILTQGTATNTSLLHQGKTPQNVLDEISGLSGVYLKDKKVGSFGSTITNFTPAKPTTNELPSNKPNSYESREAQGVVNRHARINDTLNNILTGKSHAKTIYPVDPKDTQENKERIRALNAKAGKPYTINDLEGPALKSYKKIADRLINAYPGKYKDKDYNNTDLMQEVSTLLANNKDVMTQDVVITSDITKVYGNNTVGTKSADPAKMDELLQREKMYRKFSINGEVFDYDNLPNEVKENFKSMKYAGYKSPKNFDTYLYGEEKNKNIFVSPLIYTYTDKNGDAAEIVVSRSSSERKSNSYIADALFNDIFVNTNLVADIPYKIPGSANDYISYNSETKSYIVNTKNINGEWLEPKILSENQLHTKIYDGFKVKQSN